MCLSKNSVSKPTSVQIVKLDKKDTSFSASLGSFLLNDVTKDREVVPISIAGAARKGKSFMLNFFLRYLNAMVSIYCHS